MFLVSLVIISCDCEEVTIIIVCVCVIQGTSKTTFECTMIRANRMMLEFRIIVISSFVAYHFLL